MSLRGVRDSLRAIVPKWLQDRPGLNSGFMILYGMAQQLDVLLEYAVEGIEAWWPGFTLGDPTRAVDMSTALPLLGQSRGILRGEAETDAEYAKRLPSWLDTWREAGSSEILCQQIQAWLGNTPTVRVVDRAGTWTSIAPDGTLSTVSAAWNWDSVSNPERAGYWSDLWIIVYPTEWPITNAGGPAVGNGLGHAVPRDAVDAILALVAQWKGAHTWCVAILWSYDATLFVPGVPASGDPDGTWGEWSRNVGGVQVPARPTNGTVRFWVPNGG